VSINFRRREIKIFGIVVLIGGVVIVAYKSQAARATLPPILGIVRQTEIRVAPEMSGRLAFFRVTAGQKVHKGDILAQLSNPELAASVEEARANAATARADRANVDAGLRNEEVDISAQNVTIAESNLTLANQQHDRAAKLASEDFASKQLLDERTAARNKAEASLGLAQATYEESKAGPTKEERDIAEAKVVLAESTIADLEASLAKTTLVAPVDGVVNLLVAEPGEAISPGQPVLTLGVGYERWFSFTIREDLLAGIAIGAPLNLADARGGRIEARVTELRPLGEFAVWRAKRAVGDHDVNSFLVRADPTAPIQGLEPGMTVWLDRRGRR
jgi:HlyD family secretion protein